MDRESIWMSMYFALGDLNPEGKRQTDLLERVFDRKAGNLRDSKKGEHHEYLAVFGKE